MVKPKKKPERKCIGCGEMKEKSSLIRIVRSPEGNIFIDKSLKANGRGAYICNNVSCLAKCQKAKRFDKAFGLPVPAEVYENLEGLIGKDNG
ncbi:MAG: RNase P modulator RnpM [Eubacteriales bacterium]|jgi:predicted RNA-binding protein YlxR (DUF448 family)